MTVSETLKLTVLTVPVVIGLKAMRTPFGKLSADRFTSPLNPLIAVTVIIVDPLVPDFKLRMLGEAERLKPGGGSIVTLIDVVSWRLPATPVIVTV
jgi:hypothetical protein